MLVESLAVWLGDNKWLYENVYKLFPPGAQGVCKNPYSNNWLYQKRIPVITSGFVPYLLRCALGVRGPVAPDPIERDLGRVALEGPEHVFPIFLRLENPTKPSS